jgi:hypothetical protein
MKRVLAVLLGAAAVAWGAEPLSSPTFAPGSGLSIKITNAYDTLPPSGFLPLRVVVTNDSDVVRRWTFESSHTQHGNASVTYRTELSGAAQSTQTYDLLVPLADQMPGTSRYSNLSITLSGPLVVDGSSHAGTSGASGNPTPFLGLGETLATKYWSELEARVKKSGSRSLDGTALDWEFFPTDWRGLAGFDLLVFTPEEWRALEAGQRQAIFDWTAQGGELYLARTGEIPDLPPEGAFGAGKIHHWALTDAFVADLDHLLNKGAFSSAGEIVQDGYPAHWPPAEALGRPQVPQAVILIFVIAFAILIGPVNFLVFAPTGVRHRLFWTTPLISLVASALMAGFIFFSEGVGGHGRVFSAILLQGGANQSVIWQEQIARTGVLLSGAFTPSEPGAVLLPVEINWSRRSSPSYRDLLRTFGLTGDRWSGDWFRSRRTQALALTAIVPTRARVTVSRGAGGTLSAVSTVDYPFDALWVLDDEGGVWRTGSVGPGAETALEAATRKDFDAWLRAARADAGDLTGRRITDFLAGTGGMRFFASAAPPPVATLPAIRWQKTSAVLFGTIPP